MVSFKLAFVFLTFAAVSGLCEAVDSPSSETNSLWKRLKARATLNTNFLELKKTLAEKSATDVQRSMQLKKQNGHDSVKTPAEVKQILEKKKEERNEKLVPAYLITNKVPETTAALLGKCAHQGTESGSDISSVLLEMIGKEEDDLDEEDDDTDDDDEEEADNDNLSASANNSSIAGDDNKEDDDDDDDDDDEEEANDDNLSTSANNASIAGDDNIEEEDEEDDDDEDEEDDSDNLSTSANNSSIAGDDNDDDDKDLSLLQIQNETDAEDDDEDDDDDDEDEDNNATGGKLIAFMKRSNLQEFKGVDDEDDDDVDDDVDDDEEDEEDREDAPNDSLAALNDTNVDAGDEDDHDNDDDDDEDPLRTLNDTIIFAEDNDDEEDTENDEDDDEDDENVVSNDQTKGKLQDQKLGDKLMRLMATNTMLKVDSQRSYRMAKSGQEQRSKHIAEQRAKTAAEQRAKTADEQRSKTAAEQRAKTEAEQRAKTAAEQRAKTVAEQRAKRVAEQKAKRAAERKAKRAAEQKAKQEAEQKAKQEAEQREKSVVEQKLKNAQEQQRKSAETSKKSAAEQKAKTAAEQKAKQELEEKVKAAQEQKEKNIQEEGRKSAETSRKSALEQAKKKSVEQKEKAALEEKEKIVKEQKEKNLQEQREKKMQEQKKKTVETRVKAAYELEKKKIEEQKVKTAQEERQKNEIPGGIRKYRLLLENINRRVLKLVVGDSHTEMISESQEPKFTDEKLKDAIANSKVRRDWSGVIKQTDDNRKRNAYFASGNCLCTALGNAYTEKGCEQKLKEFRHNEEESLWKQVDSRLVMCTMLWQNINSFEEERLCPVYASSGTCGLARNLDLYGRGATNGIEIIKTTAFSTDDAVRFKVETEVEGSKEFQSWLDLTARNGIEFKEGKVKWTGVIPKHIGAFLRKTCGYLKWTATSAGASVEFSGLTFRDANVGNGKMQDRKRLHQISNTEC